MPRFVGGGTVGEGPSAVCNGGSDAIANEELAAGWEANKVEVGDEPLIAIQATQINPNTSINRQRWGSEKFIMAPKWVFVHSGAIQVGCFWFDSVGGRSGAIT